MTETHQPETLRRPAAPQTHPTAAMPAGGRTLLTEQFGMNERSLAQRRRFIRLGEAERSLIADLIPWAEKAAPAIAREFYDWQFSFAPTRAFFENYAARSGMPLEALRRSLENSQAGYYREIFEGARENWSLEYFERRLHVGRVHDRIDLPFKWYVGSYAEYQTLTRKHLRTAFDDADFIARAEEAIFKVFNLDTQAIGDSFLLSTLQSIGLNVSAIPCQAEADRTENLTVVKKAIETLLSQAECLASLRLADKAFETEAQAAGTLGGAFARIRQNLVSFVEELVDLVAHLASSSTELTSVSQELAHTAEQAAERAAMVSAATEQSAKSVDVVASGSSQMVASIREIAGGANRAAQIGGTAVNVARDAQTRINKLGDASSDIGQVVKVITTIAHQTNLLALNATIEAARAGEAGKGFAVVANEVKHLAKQTAQATEDIERKVQTIQDGVSGAVQAINEISGVIDKVSDVSGVIASAVEEQTATTNEMSRNISEASQGIAEIARNINDVAAAANSTTQGASDTQSAARNLNEMAARLQVLVGRFER